MATKKAARKSPVKKSLPSRKASSSITPSQTPSVMSSSYMNSATSTQRKRMIAIFVIAAIIILALFAMKGYLVAAMVNGQPISRFKEINLLEKQYGKQVLDSLVTQSLILQEAQKRGVTVTQADTDKDLASIEANYKQQGQTLDQVLKMYNVTKAEVIEQRKPFILLDKMIGSDVKVSDKEIDDFLAKNNEAYGGTLTKAQVKQDLIGEKVKQKEQEFIAKLQKNAKIDYFVNF